MGRFINADGLVSTGQGLTGNNMFAYCLNNPVNRVDSSGCASEKATEELIKEYAEDIVAAGEEFGVDPVAIAACIYIEQVQNVNWRDYITDFIFFFLDTSIGIGQVKVSTATMLEDSGYIEKTEGYARLNHNNSTMFTGGNVTRKQAIVMKLEDPQTNIRYIAAYLKYHQDSWNSFVDISKRVEILVTLYNIKSVSPHANPQPGDFGNYYLDNKDKIDSLLR